MAAFHAPRALLDSTSLFVLIFRYPAQALICLKTSTAGFWFQSALETPRHPWENHGAFAKAQLFPAPPPLYAWICVCPVFSPPTLRFFSDEKSAAHSQRGNMRLGLFRVSSVSVGHNIAPKYLVRKVLCKLSVLKHISEILHTFRQSMWTRSADWPTPP